MNNNKFKMIFSLTVVLLAILSLVSDIKILGVFILFVYMIMGSFIYYKSINKLNLIHISWMSLCLVISIISKNLIIQVLGVSFLPLTLLGQLVLRRKVLSFVAIRFLDLILFLVGIIFILMNKVDIAVLIFINALLVRQVQFPFHVWLKDSSETRDLFPSFLYLILTQSGFVLYSEKFLYSHVAEHIAYFIPVLTLFTGLFTAVGAIKEKDILVRHLLLFVSQSCLPLAAYYSQDSTSATGGVLFAILLSVSGAISGMIAYHIYLQKGVTKIDKQLSLYRSNKNLAVIYFVASLSIVGLPFTLGYFAEDILFHGLIKIYPLLAGVYIIMTAINAFTVFKNYNNLFLGHSQYKSTPLFFKKMNKVFISLAMAFVFLGGIFCGQLGVTVEKQFLKSQNEDSSSTHYTSH